MPLISAFCFGLSRVISKVVTAAGSMSIVAVAVLIFAMVVEVITRYILNASTTWSYEVSYMSFGAIFVLGIAQTLKNDGHMRVDVFYARLPYARKFVIDGLGYLFLLLPCIGWLSFELWLQALESYQTGRTTGESAWNPPVWPFDALLAFGMSIFALQVVAEILQGIVRTLNVDAIENKG